MWRGKATFTRTAGQGRSIERYNNQPMFRYNAYFGIHTVYYMDLVDHTGCQPLPMNAVVGAAVQTMLARTLRRPAGRQRRAERLNAGLMNKLDNLKFIAYVGSDGYPVIVPVIQAQASDRGHVIFALGATATSCAPCRRPRPWPFSGWH